MKALTFYDSDGGTQIVDADLDLILAAATDTPKKFYAKSTGDEDWASSLKAYIEAVGGDPGASQLRLADDAGGTLSPPWGLTAAVAAGAGSWGATGIYFWVVVAVNGSGATVASVEIAATVSDAAQEVTVAWEEVDGATSYRVYRRTNAGTYASPSLIAVTSDLEVVDTGTPTGAGSPATTNTTGGASPEFGTPGTFGLGPLLVGALTFGQWWPFWVKRVVPSSASSGERVGDVVWRE